MVHFLRRFQCLRFVTVVDQPQELYEKLKAAGVPVSFIKVNDAHTFRTPEAVAS
jgi:acetyl esterase/lipase